MERRLAALEASMLELQTAYARSNPQGIDANTLSDLLASAQVTYDESLSALRDLQSAARRLRDWGLTPVDTVSWTAVCRGLALPASTGAHRAVRKEEPVLHVLLHRCAFPPFCTLDGASYQ